MSKVEYIRRNLPHVPSNEERRTVSLAQSDQAPAEETQEDLESTEME